MMKDENTGYVYLLVNEAMPGLVKIGMTERENLDKRLKELYSTGVPLPFECVYAAKVKNTDCKKIEHALHTAFGPQRVNQNREFFRIDPEQAKAILELFHHDDATEEVAHELDNDLTEEDKEAVTKSKAKRQPLNFFEMGFKKGDILIWKEEPKNCVEIVSARKVLYQGEECSISSLSARLKKYNTKHIAPGNYWTTTDGRLLADIYDETYPMED